MAGLPAHHPYHSPQPAVCRRLRDVHHQSAQTFTLTMSHSPQPLAHSPAEPTYSPMSHRSANTLYRGLDLFEDEYEGAGGRRRTEPNSTSKRGDGARLRRARSADPGPRHYSPVRSPVLRVDDPFKSRYVSRSGHTRSPSHTPETVPLPRPFLGKMPRKYSAALMCTALLCTTCWPGIVL